MNRFTGVINEVEKPKNVCPECGTALVMWATPSPFYGTTMIPLWERLGFCQTCMQYWTGWKDEDNDD